MRHATVFGAGEKKLLRNLQIIQFERPIKALINHINYFMLGKFSLGDFRYCYNEYKLINKQQQKANRSTHTHTHSLFPSLSTFYINIYTFFFALKSLSVCSAAGHFFFLFFLFPPRRCLSYFIELPNTLTRLNIPQSAGACLCVCVCACLSIYVTAHRIFHMNFQFRLEEQRDSGINLDMSECVCVCVCDCLSVCMRLCAYMCVRVSVCLCLY